MYKPNVIKSLLLVSFIGLSACARPDDEVGIRDPYEESNRRTHEFNVALDKAITSPAANAYGSFVPEPVRNGLSNMADTASLPGAVVNNMLQLRFDDAIHNTVRFGVNATVGLGGLFDPATAARIEERDTDFGETLAVWGVTEGNYLVLPLYGPSTERDGLGIIVDWVLDPVGQVVPKPDSYAVTGLKVVKLADDRYRYGDLIDSVLYESADPYAQLRLTYLDNRRFELGQTNAQTGDDAASAASYDLYEDFYE